MLKNAIEKCPDSCWSDSRRRNQFWHIAYHAIFYTHLYLQPSKEAFTPWGKHREGIASLDSLQKPPSDDPGFLEPYTKDEILGYLSHCQEQVKIILPRLDLQGAESGFHWLPFSKLETQFYNIRHLQQHTGELCERLGSEAGIEVPWVGMVHL
jgi:hypothetical protein